MKTILAIDDPDYYASEEVDTKKPALFQDLSTPALIGRTFTGVLLDSDTDNPLATKKITWGGVHITDTAEDGTFSFTVPEHNP